MENKKAQKTLRHKIRERSLHIPYRDPAQTALVPRESSREVRERNCMRERARKER